MEKKDDLPQWSSELSEEIIKFTHPDIMVKLIATIDPRNWPHITMITSNRAINKDQIAWGQFVKGLSKEYVQKNPKQGIFYMTAETPFRFIQIKADFSHTKTEGEEIEFFNNSDFMRYFTYVNVYKVYYNTVKAVTNVRNLPFGGIPKKIAREIKKTAKTELDEKRLNVIGYDLFTATIGIRAIGYVNPSDGYPIIIPCIQLQAADHNRLVFPPSILKNDLYNIPTDSKVAVFGMNFDFVSQVAKGTFTGFKKFRGIKFGVIEIEEIYNSSPLVVGKIYPEIETLPKVTKFEL